MALAEKGMKQGIEMLQDVLKITCSMVFTLQYIIKGSVASLRAMPTPFYCFLLQYVHASLSIHTHSHLYIVFSSAAIHCCIVECES